MLINMPEPAGGQGSYLADHRGESDVKRVRCQQRSDRNMEISKSCPGTGHGRKRCRERRLPCHYFQDLLGKIDLRNHICQAFAQVDQTRTFDQGIVLAEV